MSSRLQSIRIARPGAFGVTSEFVGANDPRWLVYTSTSQATQNVVFDSLGRLSGRKSLPEVTTSGGHTSQTWTIHEYIKDASTAEIISSAGLKIYEGTTTLTDVTGTITTPTADNWQFVNFNGKVIGVQESHPTIVYSGTIFADLTAGEDTPPQGVCALSAWGRCWIAGNDRLTVNWSGLLDETSWPSSGAGAGTLDTLEVWPDGIDRIQALAELQDRLLIFGERNILIYSGAEDPNATTFALEDVIRLGTVARDSVVNTGSDVFFYSQDGLHSARRGIQFSSLEEANACPQIKTAMVAEFGETYSATAPIKATYSKELDALIYIGGALASEPLVWTFYLNNRLENGALRALPWELDTGDRCAVQSIDGSLYFGGDGDESGCILEYSGYATSLASLYTTVPADFGAPGLKVLKTIVSELRASPQTTTAKVLWSTDYEDAQTGDAITVPASGKDRLQSYASPIYGSGTNIAIGVTHTGTPEISYGPITVHFKTGREINYGD